MWPLIKPPMMPRGLNQGPKMISFSYGHRRNSIQSNRHPLQKIPLQNEDTTQQRNLIKSTRSDCIYDFPIDLEPNGRPFGSV